VGIILAEACIRVRGEEGKVELRASNTLLPAASRRATFLPAFNCGKEAATAKGNLDEIIEMPGLQAGVLAVVSETSRLAGFFLQAGSIAAGDA
jgi:hypothetical protein